MLSFMKPNDSLTSIVFQLLHHLKINVAISTIKATLENHPDYPSLLTISDSLKQWKVDNCLLKVDKEKLHQLPVPFIAHLQAQADPFITITNVTSNNVVYKIGLGDKTLNKTIKEFLQEWSGVILLAEANEYSGEKNYKQSRKKEIFQSSKLPFVIAIVLAFAAFSTIYQYNHSKVFTAYSLLLLLNLAGCAVCGLLLWYEVDKSNPVLKQICGMGSMGKQTNCTAVLNSKQARVFNVISWSEIGFFYFAGSFISLVLAGTQVKNVLQVLVWLNVLALPYTLFSVYYQWKVAKHGVSYV